MWRHGRRVGPAALAVILERTSGQVVMGGVAALSFVSLPLAVGGVGVAALAAFFAFRRRPRTGPLATLGRDAHTALLVQLISSALIMGTFLATYLVAARAVGVSTPLWTLLPLVAPVLLSMLIPVTIAGLGGARGHRGGALGRRRTHGGGRRSDLRRIRDPGAALESAGRARPAQLGSKSERRPSPRRYLTAVEACYPSPTRAHSRVPKLLNGSSPSDIRIRRR